MKKDLAETLKKMNAAYDMDGRRGLKGFNDAELTLFLSEKQLESSRLAKEIAKYGRDENDRHREKRLEFDIGQINQELNDREPER